MIASKYNKNLFCDRLRYLIDLKKVSQKTLSTSTGVGNTQISKWLRGNTKKIQRDNAVKLAQYFMCDLVWLETGDGEPFPPPKAESAENTGEFSRRKEKKVLDDKLARIERALFKTNCPGYFDEFFDFIADNYGEDKEAAETFLNELQKTHANYRLWLDEKKRESNRGEIDGVDTLTSNNS